MKEILLYNIFNILYNNSIFSKKVIKIGKWAKNNCITVYTVSKIVDNKKYRANARNETPSSYKTFRTEMVDFQPRFR